MAATSAFTLVLGGARSGKSAHAEHLAAEMGRHPVYLATATAGDAEMAARIARHRARRGDSWRTIEVPLALPEAIEQAAGPDAPVLVDCLTLWLANLLQAGRDPVRETELLLAALRRAPGPVVLVSNEVGLGIVPDNALARRFRDEAGRMNQVMAEAAGRVVLVIAGLPQILKDNGA